MSKYYYNKDYFETIDTPEKAYWLGFLYADGCINSFYKNDELRTMNLEISLCYKDRNHLQKFADCLESNVPIHDKISCFKDKKYKASRINICCKKMCYDLIRLNCTPKKTFNISFPDDSIVPYIYKRDFLRGFFDGDGCICTTLANGNPHIVLNITGIAGMLESISAFLIKEKVLRVIPKIHHDKRSCACSMYLYGTDTNKEILDYLYKDSTVYLDRKYKKYIDFYKDYQKIEKRGVYFDKTASVYVSAIYINGKKEVVGKFANIDDAIRARKEAEIRKMNINKQPA
jgi:hypothetical protein